jgi:enamine deaminase RidA (YjgF/YER057c/UK114 family)
MRWLSPSSPREARITGVCRTQDRPDAAALAGLACDGDFERLGALRFTGFVRCGPDFADAPLVMDGASELLVLALGGSEAAVRAAVGVAALPRRSPVEIESTFEVDE